MPLSCDDGKAKSLRPDVSRLLLSPDREAMGEDVRQTGVDNLGLSASNVVRNADEGQRLTGRIQEGERRARVAVAWLPDSAAVHEVARGRFDW